MRKLILATIVSMFAAAPAYAFSAHATSHVSHSYSHTAVEHVVTHSNPAHELLVRHYAPLALMNMHNEQQPAQGEGLAGLLCVFAVIAIFGVFILTENR